MLTYRIDDMTCGRCVRAITGAIHAVDPGAEVAVDLPSHLVHVEPAQADAARLRQAIAGAGYTPVDATAPVQAAAERPARAGGCCGGRGG
jgi:copper chaperone